MHVALIKHMPHQQTVAKFVDQRVRRPPLPRFLKLENSTVTGSIIDGQNFGQSGPRIVSIDTNGQSCCVLRSIRRCGKSHNHTAGRNYRERNRTSNPLYQQVLVPPERRYLSQLFTILVLLKNRIQRKKPTGFLSPNGRV